MVFIKHNSLKSGIFFNRIFIPGFSGSRFFRVQVFQGPGFSGSRSRVQGPGPGFRSSQNITGETFFLKNHTQNVVAKLIPDPFLENQNSTYQ